MAQNIGELQIILRAIDRVTKPFRNVESWANRLGVSVKRLQQSFQQMGFELNKVGRIVNKVGKRFVGPKGITELTEKATKETKKFKMEWLGVGFLGMMVSRKLGFLNKEIENIYFNAELMNIQFSMIAAMEPGLGMLADVFYDLADVFYDLPDSVQGAAGWFSYIGSKVGGWITDLGFFTIGWDSLKTALWGTADNMGLVQKAWVKMKPWIDKTYDTVVNFLRMGWEKITAAWMFLREKFLDKIYEATIKPVIVGLQAAYAKYVAWKATLPTSHALAIDITIGITAALLALKIAGVIGDAIEQAMPGISKRFADAVVKYVPKPLRMLLTPLMGLGVGVGLMQGKGLPTPEESRRILEGFGWGGGPPVGAGQLGIPFVERTGKYLLHRGETVIPKGEGGGINFSPTVNINANLSSPMDIKEIGRQLLDSWRLDLRRLQM